MLRSKATTRENCQTGRNVKKFHGVSLNFTVRECAIIPKTAPDSTVNGQGFSCINKQKPECAFHTNMSHGALIKWICLKSINFSAHFIQFYSVCVIQNKILYCAGVRMVSNVLFVMLVFFFFFIFITVTRTVKSSYSCSLTRPFSWAPDFFPVYIHRTRVKLLTT